MIIDIVRPMPTTDLEELLEVLAKAKKSRLADFIGCRIAPAFGEHDEVVAVAGLFHLCSVGTRADGFEILLKKRLGLGLFPSESGCGHDSSLQRIVRLTQSDQL
jgi:hypothetical protein